MIAGITRFQAAVRTAELMQRSKIPPYVVVMHQGVLTTYGGRKSKFGFAAIFRTGNDAGIDENISVGCKGKFRAWSKYSLVKTTPYFTIAAKMQQ